MKLKIKLIAVIFILSNILYSQTWVNNLPDLKNSKDANFFEIQKAFNEYYKPFNVKKGKYLKNGIEVKIPNWKLYKRWEWYWEARIDRSTGLFPQTTTDAEFKKYKSNNSSLKSTNGNWTNLGPVGSSGGYAGLGRINCISFHPSDNNTYWVGSPSGGLWKTTDDGATWIPLTDNNNVLGVSDIAIPSDYATSNTIYVATGDRDGGAIHSLGGGHRGDNNTIGFLKSTNGGNTWLPAGSINVSDRRLSGFIRIHPENDLILYAGIDNLVHKSIDGAASWGYLVYTAKDYVIDMEFNPSNPDIIYLATKSNDSPQIIKTIDGGANWTISHTFESSDRRIELAVSPNDPSIVYAAVTNSEGGLSGIHKSVDNGDTFSQIFDGDITGNSIFGYYSDGSDENTGQGGYDLAFAVSPSDINTLYLGGINTWKSSDGGVSWVINNMWTGSSSYNLANPKAPTVHADKHVLKFQNSSTLFEGNDGGIYKTNDGGLNWTDLSNGMAISQIYRLGVYAGSPDTVITGLQDNGSKLFYDGNWADVTGGDGMECLIDYTDSRIQYGTYINGQISRTTNLWNSSDDIYLNIGDGSLEGAWVSPYIIDPIDHNTIYVGYDDVWKSTNKGDSFTQISTMSTANKIRSMAIAPSNNQVLYVADQSHVWLTVNGGTAWTEITGSLPVSNNSITYLAVHPYDPLTAWATFGGYDGNRIYQTIDAGTTWINISGSLPRLPVFTVVHNKLAANENHLYVGTDRGVYFKEGDADWVLFSTGLPNVMVTELEIYYDNSTLENSRLIAATYGRGLWSSDLKSVPMLSLDAGITSILNPINQNYCGIQSIIPKVEIRNYGTDILSSLSINYQIDGETVVSKNWTGSLSNSQVETVELTSISPNVGSHTLTVSISNINGGSDDNINNNTKAVSFKVTDDDFSFPYSEGFNDESNPACWYWEAVTDNSGAGSPLISFVASSTNPSATPSEGSHMVLFNSYDCDEGDQARLISPALSTLNNTNVTINFEWFENNEWNIYKDSLTLQWSLDGTTWNDGKTFYRVNETSSGWFQKSYELPSEAINKTSVYIGFLFHSAYGNNCLIDNLIISASSTESVITGTINGGPFTVSAISGAEISVPFTSIGTFSANEYTAYLSDGTGNFSNEIEIGVLTSDDNTGVIQATIPANTLAGSTYKIRVKSSNPVVLGSESNSFEIVNATSSITIGSINGSPFMVSPVQGAVVNIPFNVSGGFTSNTFTAFLSDLEGNFSNEVQIGNLSSNTNGEIFGLIAANTPNGNNYKIRIKSSNPIITSNESNALTVNLDDIRPTATLSASVDNPTNVSPIEISIAFSESITGFDLSKINVANATKDKFTILGNSSFKFELSPIADGVVSAEIPEGVVNDGVGNTNTASEKWTTTYIKALGIEDFTREGILIFPNPVFHQLNIEFGKNHKKLNLKLIGIDGKLYTNIVLLNSSNYQLDVSALANGIYIIQLNIDGKLLNARILKQ